TTTRWAPAPGATFVPSSVPQMVPRFATTRHLSRCASLLTTQRIRTITWLTLAGAAFLSIVLPILVTISDVGPDFVVGIFAPGLLLMSPVHNVIPALIVTLLVDAIVYCAVAYAILRIVLRIVRVKHP